MSENNSKTLISAFPAEPPFDKIAAAFTTRQILGLHSEDWEAPPVAHEGFRTREAACKILGVELASFTSGIQVHEERVVRVGELERGRGALDYQQGIPETDGLITNLPNVPLGVYTADCVPVFLYDPKELAIGIVHAGWRSTVRSIAALAVQRMAADFSSDPSEILAAIGPSIGRCCYEVSRDVYDAFTDAFAYSRSLFRNTGKEKWHLDLWEANRLQLLECGIGESRIFSHDLCTSCNAERLFSARRHGPGAGRILSLISIR